MPKILMLSDITGLGPDYHVGDEAMAEVAIERLGKLVGKENLILGCANPSQVPETYGIRAFSFYHVPDEAFRKLLWTKPLSYFKSIATNLYQVLRCDKVLICGGGNMTSVWPGVLEARLRLIKMANFFGKEVYLVSQTIGPYQDAHRKSVDQLLGSAKWIGVRDINFSHTQISAPVHFALDDACFLEKKHSPYTQKISKDNAPFACVSMRKFGGMDDDDVLRVASAIEKTVRQRDLNTVFIPHHAPAGLKGDIELAQKIKCLWQEKAFFEVNPIPLASELKALTADSQFVVSMRYHQLIFALSIGIPAVGIYVDEYTQAKLRGSFEALGLEPLVTSIENVEDELNDLVSKALDSRDAFEAAARMIQNEAKRASEHPYLLIAGLTPDTQPGPAGAMTEVGKP
ncbi:polysaccharide pyruvyl transferase family protein [Marinobacter zhejiangensis]|uniref:Polysaccharide pyruvyl transferase family protein WcaK n=1 Tax=Marinobacter zhejiangensis TaxID=488535 RepID=A0A1I4RNC1_9GAMM|nr:polysaccharide pyruvyl transferase family protein [Marinobacter zhejiangensis]SFM53694.1 Polysaccharide pyruvyl transferase family protein WcaK [Marinobacter zhejiangensis]